MWRRSSTTTIFISQLLFYFVMQYWNNDNHKYQVVKVSPGGSFRRGRGWRGVRVAKRGWGGEWGTGGKGHFKLGFRVPTSIGSISLWSFLGRAKGSKRVKEGKGGGGKGGKGHKGLKGTKVDKGVKGANWGRRECKGGQRSKGTWRGWR